MFRLAIHYIFLPKIILSVHYLELDKGFHCLILFSIFSMLFLFNGKQNWVEKINKNYQQWTLFILTVKIVTKLIMNLQGHLKCRLKRFRAIIILEMLEPNHTELASFFRKMFCNWVLFLKVFFGLSQCVSSLPVRP